MHFSSVLWTPLKQTLLSCCPLLQGIELGDWNNLINSHVHMYFTWIWNNQLRKKNIILTLWKLHSNIPNFHHFFIQMLMKIFLVSGPLHEKIYSLNIFGQEFTHKESKIGGWQQSIYYMSFWPTVYVKSIHLFNLYRLAWDFNVSTSEIPFTSKTVANQE